METPKILVVDDETNMRRILAAFLTREGFEVLTAGNGIEAGKIMNSDPAQIVITDLRMPGMDGLKLLELMNRRYPDVPVIMITAHGTVETAVEAMKRGAFDYISKPFEMDELRLIMSKAAAVYHLNRAELHSREVIEDGGIVAASKPLKDVLSMVRKVAGSPSTILITGESGTGKELIAQLIHNLSSRKDKPFIKINCAAIPDTLMESEFFGYEKGAFTGAVTSKPGRFELANNGTLFLDEIGEISREIQVKLLRVLQEREFERVGGLHTIHVDVRLVVATNMDLEEAVKTGRFRQDLFYRLNVVPVHLPPLRQRPEDIPPLVRHFINHFNQKLDRSIKGITPEAVALLSGHTWPGNIRELENVLERAMLLSGKESLDIDDFMPLMSLDGPGRTVVMPENASFRELIQRETEKLERHLIESGLDETGGNVTHTAKLLGLSRKGLQLKMKKYGIQTGK
ncbi:sigma-54-dependent Fis family transcriptional regulator [bacterium]|nr:sigma-54-dependent Fis family transcriptional regulator [candidate division CSSED10-310 bacterium]